MNMVSRGTKRPASSERSDRSTDHYSNWRGSSKCSAATSIDPADKQPQPQPNVQMQPTPFISKQLLPGKYGSLIPMFHNDRRQRDIREVEDQISKVIAFLEAWENVP
eukprot:5782212-Amphidinium_carterae.1